MSHKFLHEIIGNKKIWKDRPVYIVGGGSSLNNFDWNLLKGEITISVNVYPLTKINPSVIVAMDSRLNHWVMNGELGEDLKSKT